MQEPGGELAWNQRWANTKDDPSQVGMQTPTQVLLFLPSSEHMSLVISPLSTLNTKPRTPKQKD